MGRWGRLLDGRGQEEDAHLQEDKLHLIGRFRSHSRMLSLDNRGCPDSERGCGIAIDASYSVVMAHKYGLTARRTGTLGL